MTQKNKGGKSKKGKRRVRVIKPTVLANNADVRKAPKSVRAPRMAKPHHAKAVCSVTDPFCPASKGSKWPDGTSGNTLTEQFRGNYTLSSDASGNAFLNLANAAPYGLLTGTVTGSNVTTAAAFNLYKASSLLVSYGYYYRTVSMGVVIRSVASAVNSAGLMTTGTAPAASVSTTYSLGQEAYQEVAVKAIQPGMELSWISKPQGSGSRDMGIQSTTTILSQYDWTSLWVEVSGATPSIPILNIEWFLNVEFQPKPIDRTLASIAKPNPPKSTAAETAVSHVHNTLGSFIEGGIKSAEEAVMSAAKDALGTFMSDPLESLAFLFG